MGWIILFLTYFRLSLIHGYPRNAYNVNVKPLHRMGREAWARAGKWSHSCSASVSVVYILHPLPGILIAGGLCMDPTGCRKRSPAVQPVYSSIVVHVGFQIVEQLNSFKVLHPVHAVYIHCHLFRRMCACVVQVFRCHSVFGWLCKLLFLNWNCISVTCTV